MNKCSQLVIGDIPRQCIQANACWHHQHDHYALNPHWRGEARWTVTGISQDFLQTNFSYPRQHYTKFSPRDQLGAIQMGQMYANMMSIGPYSVPDTIITMPTISDLQTLGLSTRDKSEPIATEATFF